MSDKNQVTLENLNLNSAGQYRCEISAEAPLFNTVAQSKKLNVIGTLGQSIKPISTFVTSVKNYNELPMAVFLYDQLRSIKTSFFLKIS